MLNVRFTWTCGQHISLKSAAACRRKERVCIMHEIAEYYKYCKLMEDSNNDSYKENLKKCLKSWQKNIMKGRQPNEQRSLPPKWQEYLTIILTGATKLEKIPRIQFQKQKPQKDFFKDLEKRFQLQKPQKDFFKDLEKRFVLPLNTASTENLILMTTLKTEIDDDDDDLSLVKQCNHCSCNKYHI
jgi:hypothetical protein